MTSAKKAARHGRINCLNSFAALMRPVDALDNPAPLRGTPLRNGTIVVPAVFDLSHALWPLR